MNYTKQKMTLENARLISKWQYNSPYNIYSFNGSDEDIDELINNDYYSIHLDNQLIGYYCIGKAAQIPTDISNSIYKDESYIDFGLGMRPDLTGKGNGKDFTGRILQWVKAAYSNKKIRLTVASFNKRAVKVYKSLGFIFKSSFIKKSSNTEFNIMVLD